MKHRDNYEVMKERMQGKFLEYDQAAMIRKFGLRHDGQYLYLPFAGREYRISRSTGGVSWSEDGFRSESPANYSEAMSIYDVLCCAREDCCLAGSFVTSRSLSGVFQGSDPGGGLFGQACAAIDRETDCFRRACESLGAAAVAGGDAAYRFWVFPFLPMVLRFWNSDEEFPASLDLLWDANVLDFIRFETTWFVAGHVLARVQERMAQLKAADERDA